MNETRKQKPTQKEQVLAFLQERGGEGATSIEIARKTGSLRFSARIKELRDEGHEIVSQREGRSDTGAEVWRHTYYPPVEFVGEMFPQEERKVA